VTGADGRETAQGHTAARRLLFKLCDECGLDRDERLELAEVLLNTDVVSYKHLDQEQVGRLLDALRGYQYVARLHAMKAGAVGPLDSATMSL
jgi:hypothetical protein